MKSRRRLYSGGLSALLSQRAVSDFSGSPASTLDAFGVFVTLAAIRCARLES